MKYSSFFKKIEKYNLFFFNSTYLRKSNNYIIIFCCGSYNQFITLSTKKTHSRFTYVCHLLNNKSSIVEKDKILPKYLPDKLTGDFIWTWLILSLDISYFRGKKIKHALSNASSLLKHNVIAIDGQYLLKTACQKGKVIYHPASLGMMCGQHDESSSFSFLYQSYYYKSEASKIPHYVG